MAKTAKQLNDLVQSLGGRKGGRLTELAGTYEFGEFSLCIESAADSGGKSGLIVRARVPLENAGFPEKTFATKTRETAVRSFIARELASLSGGYSKKKPETGPNLIQIDRPGFEILETSAVVVGGGFIEARFTVRLPMEQGAVSVVKAQDLLVTRLPDIVRKGCLFRSVDVEAFTRYIETCEDAEAARGQLAERGLVAFVANGSLLLFGRGGGGVRREPVKFRSPSELTVTLDLPNRGAVRGMGIPAGITVIAGGWGHGKSTLLEAIARGVYDHMPGTGRELVVTLPDAVAVVAEKGRSIRGADLSPFLADPKRRTRASDFATDNATAVESQAAGIIEALEIGASLLLFDEDTSAAGLFARDAAMEALVPAADDPLSTLSEVLPSLRDDRSVSAIVATGVCGGFLSCADTVIVMKDFKPLCVTGDAKRAAGEHPVSSGRRPSFPPPKKRILLAHSLEPVSGKKGSSRPDGVSYVQYGDEFVDMGGTPQLVSAAQAKAISRGMALVRRLSGGSDSLREAVEKVMKRVESVGLDTLSGRNIGDLAGFRPHELAAAINRLKNLNVK